MLCCAVVHSDCRHRHHLVLSFRRTWFKDFQGRLFYLRPIGGNGQPPRRVARAARRRIDAAALGDGPRPHEARRALPRAVVGVLRRPRPRGREALDRRRALRAAHAAAPGGAAALPRALGQVRPLEQPPALPRERAGLRAARRRDGRPRRQLGVVRGRGPRRRLAHGRRRRRRRRAPRRALAAAERRLRQRDRAALLRGRVLLRRRLRRPGGRRGRRVARFVVARRAGRRPKSENAVAGLVRRRRRARALRLRAARADAGAPRGRGRVDARGGRGDRRGPPPAPGDDGAGGARVQDVLQRRGAHRGRVLRRRPRPRRPRVLRGRVPRRAAPGRAPRRRRRGRLRNEPGPAPRERPLQPLRVRAVARGARTE